MIIVFLTTQNASQNCSFSQITTWQSQDQHLVFKSDITVTCLRAFILALKCDSLSIFSAMTSRKLSISLTSSAQKCKHNSFMLTSSSYTQPAFYKLNSTGYTYSTPSTGQHRTGYTHSPPSTSEQYRLYVQPTFYRSTQVRLYTEPAFPMSSQDRLYTQSAIYTSTEHRLYTAHILHVNREQVIHSTHPTCQHRTGHKHSLHLTCQQRIGYIHRLLSTRQQGTGYTQHTSYRSTQDG